jgi:aarF domain-containing kinase
MIFQSIYKELPLAVLFGFKSMNRICQTATALGKTGFEWVFDGQPSSPVLLRKTFERLGATYIKLGQLVASSPSLFPEEYVREFHSCLDQTAPVPFNQMHKVLKNELGVGYMGEIFEDINPVPLASASIAQVYAAKLISGEDVVIKIQRPGVKNILSTDLNFLYYSAVILERLVPRLQHVSLAGILSEIRRTVFEECDFFKEAENIKIFAEFLATSGNTRVVTPCLYPHASSKRVLTMERLHGIPLTNREQFLKSTDHPQRIIGAAFETWMASIAGCELFHADLHAGNLMILEDGRVGFIDFGIVGRISKKTQEGVMSLIQGMMMRNYMAIAESMLVIGMTRNKVDTVLLAKDLEDFYDTSESLAEENFSAYAADSASMANLDEPEQILLEMVRIAETHGIRFPREFTLLLKQFLYFDSYGDLIFDMDMMMDGMMPDIEALQKKLEWLE